MSNRIINQISLKANEELIKRTKQRSPRYFHMVGFVKVKLKAINNII